MSNEQQVSRELSAEALKTFDFDDDGEFGPFTYGGQFVLHSDVLELLARVRREARAEAFDEALREAHFTAVVCGSNKAAVVGAIRALAAKERAS